MKHTPGPWTVKPGANDANVFYDADGQAVGTAYFRENEDEMHSNRALMSTAPDLLDAARIALSAIESGDIVNGTPGRERPVKTLLRAVIAKAEGK